ncbi:MAG: hypothetical protein U0325_31850 [Polyangiales bacterium]
MLPDADTLRWLQWSFAGRCALPRAMIGGAALRLASVAAPGVAVDLLGAAAAAWRSRWAHLGLGQEPRFNLVAPSD